jgi:predicted nucleotidyltransferase
MSCGLTQRGALPLLPDAVRAEAAVRCGADFVFALPAPFACAGAEAFARAGVHLLAAAGCDTLVFGAETPDTAQLQLAARVLLSDEYRTALRVQLTNGARSFAAARQAAAETVCPAQGLSDLLSRPNNNLAVEYCKAILELGVPLTPLALPRIGADHNESLSPTAARFASASALRRLWTQGGAEAIAPFVPASALALYRTAEAEGQARSADAASLAQLALLRSQCRIPNAFAQVRGISEGLEHRLANAVPRAVSTDDLCDRLTTVRYPRARMRRLCMDAALGYTVGSLPALPPYLHLLAAQTDALPLLRHCTLPVSPSLARLARSSTDAQRVVDAQAAASDLGTLCRKNPAPSGLCYTQKPCLLRDRQKTT